MRDVGFVATQQSVC